MRTYTQEEKQAVIARFISGEPSTSILADTSIPKSTFYSWLRIYREDQELSKRKTVNIRISICLKTKSHAWKVSLKFSNLQPARRNHH